MLIKRARTEMRRATKRNDVTGGREAVNKAYLATVHAAHKIVACSGIEYKKARSARSTQAIGRVLTLFGKPALRDRLTNEVTDAFSATLGQHTTCFYDGFCSMGQMQKTVDQAYKALKHVPHACKVVKRAAPKK